MTCGEVVHVQGVAFVCDLESDHEAHDEGMHSFTAVVHDPVAIEVNLLWGAVDYDD